MSIPKSSIIPGIYDNSYSWKEHFAQYGWTKVNINGWQNSFVEEFKAHLSSVVFMDKNKASGIISGNFGQTELQWKIRELCYPYFVDFYGGETNLLASFDGGCYMKPVAPTEEFKDWFHHDHPKSYGTEYPPQGFVNFLPNDENDGGLLLMDSRDCFVDYRETITNPLGNINRSDDAVKDLKLYKICADPGDLVLWDARCFHCSVPSIKNERMCLYVSMQPRKYANDAELKTRISYYEEGRQTGHLCYGSSLKMRDHWERLTEDEKLLKPRNPIAVLNDLRRQLIGY